MQLALPKVPKKAVLPLVFAGLGASYFALTVLRRPSVTDFEAGLLWERHKRDARFALVAGIGAGALLWWARG
jgi:hypothetical protein